VVHSDEPVNFPVIQLARFLGSFSITYSLFLLTFNFSILIFFLALPAFLAHLAFPAFHS